MNAPETNFISFLADLGPLETPLAEFLTESIKVFEYPQGYVLKALDEPAKYVWYLCQGTAKMYQLGDAGQEEVIWLWLPNELIYAPGALYLQKTIDFQIHITQKAQVVRCPITHLHYASQLFPAFVTVSHRLVETYLLQLILYLHSLQHVNPQERYHEMIQKRPQLVQQFKLATLASFLGVSLSTLRHLRY